MARTPVLDVPRKKTLTIRVSLGEFDIIEGIAKKQEITISELLRNHIVTLVSEAMDYSEGEKSKRQAVGAVTNSASTIIENTPVSDEALKSRTQRQLDLWRAGAGSET